MNLKEFKMNLFKKYSNLIFFKFKFKITFTLWMSIFEWTRTNLVYLQLWLGSLSPTFFAAKSRGRTTNPENEPRVFCRKKLQKLFKTNFKPVEQDQGFKLVIYIYGTGLFPALNTRYT